MSLLTNVIDAVSRRATGALYEKHAVKLLRRENIEIVTQNFTVKGGEIDIIARDGDKWLFVEVRFRQSNRYGSAASTVSAAKQKKLRYTAHKFFQQRQINSQHCYFRFDIIAFDQSPEHYKWIKNAF